MVQPHSNIVMVGGGPAGIFAALALDSVGASVTVIADERPANTDARTTALLDGSVKALERLHVWQRCAHLAAPLKVMRLIDDTGRLLRAPPLTCDCAEIGLEAFGYNIENRLLNDALLERLGETSVRLVKGRATAVTLGEHGGSVTTSDGECLEADLVVGADGRNSIVRLAADVDMSGENYPQVAITTNLAVERPHNNISTEFHTVDGPCTVVPLPGLRVSIVCAVKPENADAYMAMDDAAWGRELERRTHSLLGKMTVEGMRGRFPLGRATPSRFGGAGFALVGEAAHIIPPIGAQGLNLGLRDGAALADCVSDALKSGEALGRATVMQRYDAARRPDIVSRTMTVDLFNKSLFSSLMPLHGMRGIGLWLMDQVPFIRRTFMKEGLQPQGHTPRLMRA